MKSILIAVFLFTAFISASLAADLDTAKIDNLTGLKGKLNEKEGVYKVSLPRDDVKIAVAGWQMPPLMGDTVLFEDEVNTAMSAALDNGLSVTALHNHFFFDQPKIYFMHIEGEGSVDQLAGAVRKVYDSVKAIRKLAPKPGNSFAGLTTEKKSLPEKSSISAAPLNDVFGSSGEVKDGMVKFTIGKKSSMDGMDVGNTMGVNTWAAFAGSEDNAVVDGDFAMTEDELQPVLKSLRKSGINIVAIHNHMTHETPRIMFLHFWGRGPAEELAKAIKTSIDLTESELTRTRS
jgi:hypothetical protein